MQIKFGNRLLLLAVCLGSVLPAAAQYGGRVNSVGKETPRTRFFSYDNREEALAGDPTVSESYKPLDGMWKFRLFGSAAQAPVKEAAEMGNPLSGWDSVRIVKGVGTEFPVTPGKTPVAIFKRTFDIPYAWFDKAIYLVESGAGPAVSVWINGEEAGYNSDPQASAEFFLNNYLYVGQNEITLAVYGTADALLDESKDTFSALAGEIYIHAQPKSHIHDLDIQARLDSADFRKGFLNVAMVVGNDYNGRQDLLVGYDIIGPDGKIVTYNNRDIRVDGNSRDTLRLLNVIDSVHCWSAEDPALYTLLFRVKRGDRFIEYFPYRFGFRNVEWDEQGITLNGKPAAFRAVAYSPRLGKDFSVAEARKELAELKKQNVNTLVLGNFPGDDRFYDLCDEMGFYLSLHPAVAAPKGATKSVSAENDPSWLTSHLERTESLYLQARNHPSVVCWSLGGGTENGYNLYKSYQYLKGVENTRPVWYAPALEEWNSDFSAFPRAPQWDKLTAEERRELKKAYAPVTFGVGQLAKGEVILHNGYTATDLRNFSVTYKILDSRGNTVYSRVLKPQVAPGADKMVKVNLASVPRGTAKKYTLFFSVKSDRALSGYPKGYEVAQAEFEIPAR